MNSISLSELSLQIQEALKLNFGMPVWIRAEISELRENYNGNCYLELIEKDQNSETILAKSKATVWASTYRMLKPYFESSTGQVLRSGLNVLVAVSVEYHAVYGFSLNVRDINPTYTLGEMAAQRLKIIRQLEEDGVSDMNKLLSMPELPQRIAIISSATAAGYDDFCDQLKQTKSGFVFYKKLFQAVMQGEQAQKSIITALEKIYEHIDLFDVVVIIRGGGATTDLACFDSYELAINCAQFPLPIIAGIGHQRDVSILDLIAHTSVKTPTAAAEFLISKLQLVEDNLMKIAQNIQFEVNSRLESEFRYMDQINLRIKHTLQNKVQNNNFRLEKLKDRLKRTIEIRMYTEKNKLLMLEKSIETHSPIFLLKHGYTITTINGKRISSIKELKSGLNIRTYVQDGDFESEITNCNTKN